MVKATVSSKHGKTRVAIHIINAIIYHSLNFILHNEPIRNGSLLSKIPFTFTAQ